MLRWDRYVLRPRIWMETSRSGTVPHIGPYSWDPMIKIKLNNFSCYALCDVGARTSVMPKRMYDMLELKPVDSCSFGVRLVDSTVKKPLGKIDDVLIIVNDNYVPVDFTIMDIECEPSC